MIYSAIVFLPALGGLIAGLFGPYLGPRPSELVTTALLLVPLHAIVHRLFSQTTREDPGAVNGHEAGQTH